MFLSIGKTLPASAILVGIDAEPSSVFFTILRETGGIKPKPIHRNITNLTVSEREEILVALSAKRSILAIARMLNLSLSREVTSNRVHRYYKAIDADNRAKRPLRQSRLHTRKGHRASINIVTGVSIHERAKHIENRKSLGHWEGDIIIFKRNR